MGTYKVIRQMQNPFPEAQASFSIVCPVYGETWKTLPRFFGALAEQSYPAKEIVVVFDGPNPEGRKELIRLEAEFKGLPIRSMEIPHGGAPAARNAGAGATSGDCLLFLDPDVYLVPGTLQFYATALDENPGADVVWGYYDILDGQGQVSGTIGANVPRTPDGNPDYRAFRYSNYCSGGFPVRRTALVGWDETVKSLQDWDMWYRMLAKDGFKGSRFAFYPRSFFLTDAPRHDGISADSAANWEERVRYVREKNGFPLSETVVTSGGAPWHALNVAEALGYDFLPDPSFKPNSYRNVLLLGFYTNTELTLGWHAKVLSGPYGKKAVHWIGTDVWQLHNGCSWRTLKELRSFFEKEKVVHLSEFEGTRVELEEVGIGSEVVPIPPSKLFSPLPLPDEFAVAVYENGTQDMYMEELMAEVARSMPDVRFYFFGDGSKKGNATENSVHLGWIDMEEWMPKFSLNLRMTVHDGLPLTPLQFLTAGRTVVSNVPLQGAVLAGNDRKEIVEAIRKAKNGRLRLTPKETSDRWNGKLDQETYKKRMEDVWSR